VSGECKALLALEIQAVGAISRRRAFWKSVGNQKNLRFHEIPKDIIYIEEKVLRNRKTLDYPPFSIRMVDAVSTLSF